MSVLSLRLSDSLHEKVKEFSSKEGMSINQFITSAVSERRIIMLRKIIITSGNSAAVLLPQEILEKIGIAIGDEIDISIKGRTVILQPLEDSERTQKIDATIKSVFRRRKSAYEQLAKEIH